MNSSAATMGTMVRDTTSTKLQRKELFWVSIIIVTVSCVLLWRYLPLPHQDRNFYVEPGYQLAQTGKLIGPGSQNVDLTYQKEIYSYPPGYFLLVAGWLKLFGLTPRA